MTAELPVDTSSMPLLSEQHHLSLMANLLISCVSVGCTGWQTSLYGESVQADLIHPLADVKPL